MNAIVEKQDPIKGSSHYFKMETRVTCNQLHHSFKITIPFFIR